MNQNEPFYGLTPFRQILWSSAFRRLRLNRSAQSPKPRLNHTQSNRIKPNQTKKFAVGDGHRPPGMDATGAASGSACVPRAVPGVAPGTCG
jgi:hypothetical protein